LDEQLYPYVGGCETFYGILKPRLNLEHFSGKTVESIYQDFDSTVFLTGFESILTEDSKERNKIPSASQSCGVQLPPNAMKNHIFELLELLCKKNLFFFINQIVI